MGYDDLRVAPLRLTRSEPAKSIRYNFPHVVTLQCTQQRNHYAIFRWVLDMLAMHRVDMCTVYNLHCNAPHTHWVMGGDSTYPVILFRDVTLISVKQCDLPPCASQAP